VVSGRTPDGPPGVSYGTRNAPNASRRRWRPACLISRAIATST